MNHSSKKSREDDLIGQLAVLREKLSELRQKKIDLVNVQLENDYIDVDDLETCEAFERYNNEVLQSKNGKFFSGHLAMMGAFSCSVQFERTKHDAYHQLLQTGNELRLQFLLRCHEMLTGYVTPPSQDHTTYAEEERMDVLTGMIESTNHRIRTLTNLSIAHEENTNTIKSWIILAGHVIYEMQRLRPFLDGNKRMGELLGNYILQKQGRMPFVVTLYDEDQLSSSSDGDKHVFQNRGDAIQLLGSRIASRWKDYDAMSAATSVAMFAPSSSRLSHSHSQSHSSHRKGGDDGATTSAISSSTDGRTIERAVVSDLLPFATDISIYPT